MGFIDTVINSVKRELSESATRPTHYAIIHAVYKKRLSDDPNNPLHHSFNHKSAKTVEYKVPYKPKDPKSSKWGGSFNNPDKNTAYIKSHPDHQTLTDNGWVLRTHSQKDTKAIKEHNEEVKLVIAEIESNIIPLPVKKETEAAKMESSRPVGVVLSFIKKEEQVDEALRSDIIKKASKDAAVRSADPRTKPGDAPAWLTKAIKDRAAKKVQKEETELEEAVTVKKSTHSWGKMITVHHGSSHSFPLHPEHQEKIAKLKDGEHTSFTDETNSKVTAHREGDTVHLSLRGSNTKTPVAMSHFKEEVNQVDEKSLAALAPPRDKVTHKDVLVGRGVLKQHPKDPDKHVLAKEDVELDEAKRGRPRKDGSKPAGDDEHQEADKNIHTQLHKVISANKPFTFNNGKTHQITAAHAHKALHLLQNAKSSERLAIQHSLSHSHDRFHETLKSGKAITDAPRPKVSLAKSVREDADPVTRASDKGAMTTFIKIGPDGRPKLVKRSGSRDEIKVESVNNFAKQYTDTEEEAEEKKEGQTAPKGASADLTVHAKKYEKDPLFSKIKMKLPLTVGNKAPGGEDTEYGGGKYSVAEEKTLNSLYGKLDENNKKIFEDLIQTEEGVAKLMIFATEQGI